MASGRINKEECAIKMRSVAFKVLLNKLQVYTSLLSMFDHVLVLLFFLSWLIIALVFLISFLALRLCLLSFGFAAFRLLAYLWCLFLRLGILDGYQRKSN